MSNLNEVEEAFATLIAQQAGALLVSGDPTFLARRERLATLQPTMQYQRSISTARSLRLAGS